MDALTFISKLIWPILLAAALFHFRKEIKGAFGRIREVGPTGVKLDNAQAVQQQTTTATPKSATSDTISAMKQAISADQLEPAARDLMKELTERAPDLSERFELAAHAAASLNIQLTHERVYRVIFGSQLATIVRANEVGGITEEAMRKIYDEVAPRHPEVFDLIDYENWKGFLLRFNLIRFDPQRKVFEATQWGRGFLRYLIDLQLPTTRPF